MAQVQAGGRRGAQQSQAGDPATAPVPVTGSSSEFAELAGAVNEVIRSIMNSEPLLGLLLSVVWVYGSRDVDAPAWTDGRAIYINPDLFLKRYKKEGQAYILAHELLHIVMGHVQRARDLMASYPLPPEVYNIVADAKVNYLLDQSRAWGLTPPPDRITNEVLRAAGVEEPERKSMEDIIAELWARMRKGQADTGALSAAVKKLRGEGGGTGGGAPRAGEGAAEGGGTRAGRGEGGGEGGGESRVDLAPPPKGEGAGGGYSGVLVRRGSDRLDPRAPEEVFERGLAEAVFEAAAAARAMGRDPGLAQRLIDELPRPRQDWRRLLRVSLSRLLGSQVKRTWYRPSRKFELFPGKALQSTGRVVVLVDTSGSVSGGQLASFLGEVYGIARAASEVVVVPWDAQAYEPIVLRSPSDIARVKAKGLMGGGGTVIRPALELLDKKYRDAAAVVIMSDWLISDLGDPGTEALLRKYAPRTIAVTVGASPPEYLRKVIRLAPGSEEE